MLQKLSDSHQNLILNQEEMERPNFEVLHSKLQSLSGVHA
ncbi:hypothetical protein VCHE48_1153 [Vibrio cholerae HE48]|nr:hypothetical protein VCHE48_1153 [Vibrio cholerae HE48]